MPDQPLARVLAAIGLSHLLDLPGLEVCTFSELATLERGELLAKLKDCGVAKLIERQKTASALAKAAREDSHNDAPTPSPPPRGGRLRNPGDRPRTLLGDTGVYTTVTGLVCKAFFLHARGVSPPDIIIRGGGKKVAY